MRRKSAGDRGEYETEAIRRELIAQITDNIPKLQTVGRIVDRNCDLDGLRRVRCQALTSK